ncbi:mate efflux family [Lecanosticta acicola]|uniref:Mate efflux family n=1 Tax=Lecanosticta acicola TaxID=111012 RepID=A0AAI9E972_9PEZI|nr:mate efflux family [Lecanosticta acicola]
MSKAIARNRSASPATGTSQSFGTSYRSQSRIAAIAEESIAQDLEDEALEDNEEASEESPLERINTAERIAVGPHSMTGYYRRPSYMATTPRPFLGTQQPEHVVPVEQDWEAAIGEERSLLRDNGIIPPKHPRGRSEGEATGDGGKGLRKILSRISTRRKSRVDEEAVDDRIEPSENTALLGDGGRDPTAPYGGEGSPENVSKKWEEAVEGGKIQTSWKREAKVLGRYSGPLIFTFILQNSLTLTSIFTVGHIGKNELGAVSLGSMTANITGYAVYQGLATSLDTLCAQAYGSGNKKLVGLYLQRMIYFLWAITIPIAIIWAAGTEILDLIVPEREIAELAGAYLKILIIGAPGYACFESAKRYVQAQGRFEATLYVLLIAAPLNILMHWLFVWKLEWGFIGCPIAVVITESLMPLLLFLYVRFFGGMECWPGFSRKAFTNWGPMVRLALPGLVMVLAEFLAFEILTLASARISATHLAANTVLQSLSVLTYQLPFPLSIAASTRCANLVGAGLPDAAKTTTKVTFVLGTIIGIFNMVVLSSLRFYIPWLFTSELDVVELAAATLPVNAAFQLFDALAAQCNGLLRGLGKQAIGGYINLFAYYVIALPLSFGLGFGLHWDLIGLWTGPAIGLAIVSALEGIYIYRTNYEKASEEAAQRNAAA